MTVVERFDEFFAAVNGGARPYPWQRRLVEEVARTGRWPTTIGAPTGSGKSSVVDVHVFLVAERHRVREGESPAVARPPRRLVLVAPRRVLVEDQYERALNLAELLRTSENGIVKEIAEALRELRSAPSEESDESPLGVSRLRGGVLLDHSWRLDPTQCQVICATPLMWGSRLLLRGYRGTRLSRNLEAGLLGHDAVAVIDEAHLHERLVETARRIAGDQRSAVPLQVVAMSATRTEDAAITLSEADLEDERLRRRVLADKQIRLAEVDDWRREHVEKIVELATEARATADGTVGVFVNTVDAALDVANRLDGEVEVVCGRMRPADLAALRKRREGLLDARGDASVDFLVSTQSLEVGVDLDLPAVVTALAPASALAQRAGRLNRSGSRRESTFAVVVPRDLESTDPKKLAREFAPYEPAEIVAALAWLERLGGDASPHRISSEPLPPVARPPLPPLSRVDLETLAMTSNAQSADPDVTLYVEEPRLHEDRLVSIGARDYLAPPERTSSEQPLSDDALQGALLAAPPRAHELASLAIGPQLDAILAVAREHSWVLRSSQGKLSAERIDADYSARPGDVVLVPAGSEVVVRGIIGRPRTGRAGRTVSKIEDVMRARPPEEGDPDLVVMLAGSEVRPIVEQDPTLSSRAARDALAQLTEDRDAARRLKLPIRDVDVSWHDDGEAPCGLLVIKASRRQGQLPRGAATDRLVSLGDHATAVEQRMRRVLARMDAPLVVSNEQLEKAALLHDEGKAHPRFQRRMGAQPGDPLLAKPRPGWAADRGEGWRHEQLSAAYALAATHDPLVAVLIAAHHGHGRYLFDRDADALIDGWEECDPAARSAATALFGPAGRYERERASAQRALGVHGLAHAEALLRCADMQVSGEGS